jgi:hypothetical protein
MSDREQRVIEYRPPGPVVDSFFASAAFVRGIMGPIGSGKSTACVAEILARAGEQAPGFDGVRRTRWAVIRNSYPELKTTTVKTWGDWCPPQYGRLTWDSPIRHHIKVGDLDVEVLFMALDREEDQKKLLSLELTGAWVNEAREIPKAIIDALTGRVGRYPSKSMGGCTWSGIFMDTNPPDDQHWWYKLAEEELPQGWQFFRQPSGRSEKAENIENLPAEYYNRIMAGKDPDWIKVYVDGEYGFVTEGKPVYPMYRDRIHCAPAPIEPVKGMPILIGQDFGLTPAAVIGQKLVDGRWLILDELCADSCGTIRFAELLYPYIAQNYPGFQVGGAWGDPAGNQRGSNDEKTALELMKAHTHESWRWRAAPTNEFLTRREVVVHSLNRLVDGNPGILISPKCATVRKGFAGGYHFKFIKTGNGVQTHEAPNKNAYSHPHDALQYLLLGAGEYAVAAKKVRPVARPKVAKDLDYRILG